GALLPKVLICAADALGPGDLRPKLLATNSFSAVDLVDCGQTTPALATLLGYDSVLTFDNNQYKDAALLGDTLADYVDQGGGVVQMNFALDQGLELGGRWSTDGYSCILPGAVGGSASLTAVPKEPASPLVQGVTGLTSQWRSTGALNLARGALSAWD